MAFAVGDSEIHLSGHCPIEEAEALHDALRGIERPVFDLTQARYLHTSIIQLIVASAGTVRGAGPDEVLSACFRNLSAA